MRITATLAAAVAALVATVGMAQTPERRLSHSGKTYAYTSTDLGRGRQLIEGRSLPGNKPFRLVVRGNRVSGTVGTVPIAFRVDAARGASEGGVLLASR